MALGIWLNLLTKNPFTVHQFILVKINIIYYQYNILIHELKINEKQCIFRHLINLSKVFSFICWFALTQK
ncbi:hypothetical protein AB204_00630 [Xenorhabdus khoisanae]|uniref:Uncharacterized protein n=1 Tax=Xenorhabdus khoisanae TaxID=880157 RepID=A0A0J5IV70_9GAMM|nr:hypothetical protein AB204_00630 [Xenorhabdus khoisanae]